MLPTLFIVAKLQTRETWLGLLLFFCCSAVSSQPEPLRVGFWSSWNIPCGIAMYTKHMVTSLQRLPCKTFTYHYTMPITQLKKAIARDKIHVLNIQYEIGLMPPLTAFLALIQSVQKTGVKVVITVHDEPYFADSFARVADLCIYHKPPGHIKKYKHKVIVLPMGVPLFSLPQSRSLVRKRYGYLPQHKILVTTGFLLITKELDVILKLLTPYLKAHPDIRLQLLNGVTPRNPVMSDKVKKQVESVLNDNNLWDQVYFTGNFIPQRELSERIWMSDLGYQWFSMHTFANSGAAREFVSARCPVVLPRSTHYYGLEQGVVRTPHDKSAFISAITKTLENKLQLKQLTEQSQKEYERLNYDAVVSHYYEAMKQCITKRP